MEMGRKNPLPIITFMNKAFASEILGSRKKFPKNFLLHVARKAMSKEGRHVKIKLRSRKERVTLAPDDSIVLHRRLKDYWLKGVENQEYDHYACKYPDFQELWEKFLM